MKKGIIIAIIIVLAIGGVAGGTYYYLINKNEETEISNEKEKNPSIKEVAEKLCITKSTDLDSAKEFVLENMDFKAFIAYKKTNIGMSLDNITDYDSYKKEITDYFNKSLKEITDEEVEEQKKEIEDNFTEYFIVRDDDTFHVDSIGVLKESYTFPAVDEVEVTYKNQNGDTREHVIFFYDGKFLAYFKKSSRESVKEEMERFFEAVQAQQAKD